LWRFAFNQPLDGPGTLFSELVILHEFLLFVWVLIRKTKMTTRLSKSKKVYDLLAHFRVNDVLALNN